MLSFKQTKGATVKRVKSFVQTQYGHGFLHRQQAWLCVLVVKIVTYKSFSYHPLHLGLTQEKFGSEKMRLAPLAPLPTIEVKIHNKTISLLFARNIVS